MPAPRTAFLILNPIAGRTGGRRVLAGLTHRMTKAGWVIQTHITRRPGDARHAATQACLASAAVLLVAGGDGTIREAISGLTAVSPPILVVPHGTENIMAKCLGLGLDAAQLWDTLRAGRFVSLDIPSMGGRRFLLVSGVGFDAEVARRLHEQRCGHIDYLTYLWPTWRTFWSCDFPRLFVEADGVLVSDSPGLVFIGNVPRYAVGTRILDRASPTDGLLDLCILRCAGRAQLLRHAVNLFAGRHLNSPNVYYRQATKVRVWADRRVPVHLDGDPAGWLPAEFALSETRARFLVPPAFTAWPTSSLPQPPSTVSP